MELLEALEIVFDHAGGIVAGVRADQLDVPTPCREWDLGTLLAHMTGVVVNCGRGASGADPLPLPARPLEGDVAAQFRAAALITLAAWRACDLDGKVDIGAGPRPAYAALGINLLDTATHSWDVAQATGQDPTLPAGVAEMALAVSREIVDDGLRQFAGFAPALTAPEGAGPTAALVAFLGRRP